MTRQFSRLMSVTISVTSFLLAKAEAKFNSGEDLAERPVGTLAGGKGSLELHTVSRTPGSTWRELMPSTDLYSNSFTLHKQLHVNELCFDGGLATIYAFTAKIPTSRLHSAPDYSRPESFKEGKIVSREMNATMLAEEFRKERQQFAKNEKL